ncbi:hypothetical protein OS493_025349 [Desmophyllum pertusum]|uniref:Uncharacterized protein n=1 Tax=Desmophyllum pertusum TaxID=174260 RepID=A0A9W9ZAE4_9CNID|nr:hypothetical protein OS493_025349 [Desmophyllum pertusum]
MNSNSAPKQSTLTALSPGVAPWSGSVRVELWDWNHQAPRSLFSRSLPTKYNGAWAEELDGSRVDNKREDNHTAVVTISSATYTETFSFRFLKSQESRQIILGMKFTT